MTNISPLTQLLRSWELPIAIEKEESAAKALEELAAVHSQSVDDFTVELHQASEEWKDRGELPEKLRVAFNATLQFAPEGIKSFDGTVYADTYQKLRKRNGDIPPLTHLVTKRLLSRTPLMAQLLAHESFSCSQVSRLLSTLDASLDVPYGTIQTIARKLNIVPSLDIHDAGDKLWKEDQELSSVLFPDTSLAEGIEIAEEEISTWLPNQDFKRLLTLLCGGECRDQEPRWPYLQMLHWCLTPIHFFDHPVSYLYEFSPRGRVALSLFDRYPTSTGNPVLNNAKAVQTLDSSWARNRGNEEAHALVAILSAMESLPFVPRRQIARVLRAWLIRCIELRAIPAVKLNGHVDKEVINRSVDFICTTESNTQGVIEQRIVDALSLLAFGGEGWRARGLRDGVNASNLSRKKLGDVEFSNVDERKSIAVEAHGGHLSVTYVASHQKSLQRLISQRLDESWGALDDPEHWTVSVLFIAHSRADHGLPDVDVIEGVNVSYHYLEYADLAQKAFQSNTDEDIIVAFRDLVIGQLNESRVRQSARDKFASIAGWNLGA